jgi:4-hydroxyphenylpyruvate dioxygenase-like putative hemolysin
MREPGIGTDAIVHVALVVADVAATVEHYARIFHKMSPQIRLTGGAEGAVTLRGVPTAGRAKLAIFKMGKITLEIIEPVGGASVWQEYLDRHGPGVHHIGFLVPDMARALAHFAAEGQPVVQQAPFNGGQYAYIETEGTLGVMLELLELH